MRVCVLPDHDPPLNFRSPHDIFSSRGVGAIVVAVQYDHDQACYCKYTVGDAWQVDTPSCTHETIGPCFHRFCSLEDDASCELTVCEDCQALLQDTFDPETPPLSDLTPFSSLKPTDGIVSLLFVEKRGEWMTASTIRYLADNWEYYHPGLERSFDTTSRHEDDNTSPLSGSSITDTTESSPSARDYSPPRERPLLLPKQKDRGFCVNPPNHDAHFHKLITDPDLVYVDKTAILQLTRLCSPSHDYLYTPFIRQPPGTGLATFTSMVAHFYDCYIDDETRALFADCAGAGYSMGTSIVLHLDLANVAKHQDVSLPFSQRLSAYLRSSIDALREKYGPELSNFYTIEPDEPDPLDLFITLYSRWSEAAFPLFIIVENYTSPWTAEPDLDSLYIDRQLFERIFQSIRSHLYQGNIEGALVTGYDWPSSSPPLFYLKADEEIEHPSSRFVDLSDDPVLATTFGFTKEEVEKLHEVWIGSSPGEELWERFRVANISPMPPRRDRSFFEGLIQFKREPVYRMAHVIDILRSLM